jgi:hypothetical protein
VAVTQFAELARSMVSAAAALNADSGALLDVLTKRPPRQVDVLPYPQAAFRACPFVGMSTTVIARWQEMAGTSAT